MVLLIINWLWEGQFAEKLQRLKEQPYLWVLSIFWGIYLIGTIYSSHTALAWADIKVKLPLLVLPVIISSIKAISAKQLKLLLQVFVGATFLASLICLGAAAYKDITLGFSTKHYTYTAFSDVLMIHPHFLSMFINMACLCIWWKWWNHQQVGSSYAFWKMLLPVSYFFVMLILLASRMELIIFGILCLSVLIYMGYVQQTILKSLTMAVGLVLLASVLVSFHPNTRKRMINLVEVSRHPEQAHLDGASVRLAVWKGAGNLIQSSPWIGYGTGSVKPILTGHTALKAGKTGLPETFDAHNQYLNTLLELGAIGLIVLVLVLGVPFVKGFQNQNPLLLGCMILWILSCLTESMLSRQLGVGFFALFIPLLLFHHTNPKLDTNPVSQKELTQG